MTHLNFSAVLPLLQEEWDLSHTQAGVVAAAGQAGFVVAVLALGILADRWSTRGVFVGASVCAGLAAVGFGALANGFWSATMFKLLGGVGIGGTYMPGVKLVSAGRAERRGLSVALFVASIPLGLALSLGATGLLTRGLGWRAAFALPGVLVLVSAGAAMWRLRDGGVLGGDLRPSPGVLPRPALLLGVAYFAHNWELMGLWSWLTTFLTASLVLHGDDTGRAAALAAAASAPIFVVGGLGVVVAGHLSDRVGRTAAALGIGLASISICVAIGWLVALPFAVVVVLVALHYMLALADSPVLSTGLTELVAPEHVGSALGVYAAIGWLSGAISPAVFGAVLDATGGSWGAAFAALALVALLGPCALIALRRDPVSARMARGLR